MQSIDQIMQDVAARREPGTTVIVCLYTAPSPPACCEPMPRLPTPEVGMPFDRTFLKVLVQATGENLAVRDGAIMVGRTQRNEPYRIAGWSFRLFPQVTVADGRPNRGSAFNSCLSMSGEATVDGVYLVSEAGAYRFIKGEVAELGARVRRT
jgi:hypothetical protein